MNIYLKVKPVIKSSKLCEKSHICLPRKNDEEKLVVTKSVPIDGLQHSIYINTSILMFQVIICGHESVSYSLLYP